MPIAELVAREKGVPDISENTLEKPLPKRSPMLVLNVVVQGAQHRAIGGSKGGRARRIPGGSGGRESPLL